MFYTTNLEEVVLFSPALLIGNACNTLKIISAFTDCGRIMSHLIELKDGSTGKNKIYPSQMKIDLLIGMTKGNSLTKKKHVKIRETIKRINEIKGMPHISCRYIYTGMEVHSKVYIWGIDNNPVIAFCGSANYTINAFQKRRESMSVCDEQAANQYYDELLKDSIDCLSEGIEDKIHFSAVSVQSDDEIDSDNIENLTYEDYCKKTPLQTLRLSLLTANGRVGFGSGINWGIRPNGTKRDRDQAYIPYNVDNRIDGFFPDRIHPEDKNCPLFKVITKEIGAFYMRMAQQNNKALQSAESNAILGRWIRDKIGVPSGTFITKEMLEKYGTSEVVFKKYENNVYILEFDPKI